MVDDQTDEQPFKPLNDKEIVALTTVKPSPDEGTEGIAGIPTTPFDPEAVEEHK